MALALGYQHPRLMEAQEGNLSLHRPDPRAAHSPSELGAAMTNRKCPGHNDRAIQIQAPTPAHQLPLGTCVAALSQAPARGKNLALPTLVLRCVGEQGSLARTLVVTLHRVRRRALSTRRAPWTALTPPDSAASQRPQRRLLSNAGPSAGPGMV